MKTVWSRVLTAASLLAVLASSASAQSAIAGSAKDPTGLALPGVTIEASSPALIEKTRTVTTDEQGLYQIANLPPGTYRVSFGLPGFTTDVSGPEPVSAEQTTPTQVQVTFSAAIAAANAINVPFRDPAIRNASGGFVVSNTFPV